MRASITLASWRDVDRFLRPRQWLAVGDAELQLDEVDAEPPLRHRVLDLEPGVDLEEVDRAVVADEELDGAGVLVTDMASERERALQQRLPGLRRRCSATASPR